MYLITYLFAFIGLVLFSFVVWRKLREDYTDDQIFTLTLSLTVIAGIGNFLLSQYLAQFPFWPQAVFIFLGLFYLIRKMNMKFFEAADAFAPAWFIFYLFFLVGVFIEEGLLLNKYSELFAPIVALLAYQFFQKNYRRFSWYPSGKVGFAGLAALVIFFAIRAPVAIYSSGMVLLGGIVDGIASLVLTILLLAALYRRSGRQGVGNFLKWQKR